MSGRRAKRLRRMATARQQRRQGSAVTLPPALKLPGGRLVTAAEMPPDVAAAAGREDAGPAGQAAVDEWLAAQPLNYQLYAAVLGDSAARLDQAVTSLYGTGPWQSGGRLYVPDAPAVRKFTELHGAGQVGLCKHVRALAPAPAVWQAWAPRKARCVACARLEDARVKGTKEDRRCDECGTIQPKITPGLVELGPRNFNGVVVPVLAAYGLCGRCSAVTNALLAAGPPAGPPQGGPGSDPSGRSR